MRPIGVVRDFQEVREVERQLASVVRLLAQESSEELPRRSNLDPPSVQPVGGTPESAQCLPVLTRPPPGRALGR